MKKGFSLILAIIFILLVASIGALSMSISSSSAKTSVNLFIHEQAKLLADGAAEYWENIVDYIRKAFSGYNIVRNLLCNLVKYELLKCG